MKPWVKIALGIFTSLFTIGFIFIYDFYIKDRIDSVEVVVVKAGERIEKSETLTEEKLTTERRPKETLVDGVILASDFDTILGYDAAQAIAGNAMLSKTMVDFDQLVPDESIGEAIRPIPNDWIYAAPGSLRRKDRIDIYLVYRDGSTHLNQNGPSSVTAGGEPEGEESTPPTSQQNESVRMDSEPFLKDIRVVYAKDSGNNEVVSADSKEDGRLNATSTIHDLEVILNEADFFQLMKEVLERNAKLYITYQ